MAPMRKGWTDAKFEVVKGPDGWLQTPLVDALGRPLWYRPPRFRRWQLFLMLCAGVLAFRAVFYLSLWLLHGRPSY